MNKIEQDFLYAIRLHAQFDEVWLPVKGYLNYEVSSRGRVTNIKKKTILKPQLLSTGYHYFELCRHGKATKTVIHRLVAMTFIPNLENKPCIDHIDYNRLNNNVDNLRWCTYSENGMNKIKQRNNTSGIVGVCWNKSKQKWRARLNIDGVEKHLGYFNSMKAAKSARIKAVNSMFGVFANKKTNC